MSNRILTMMRVDSELPPLPEIVQRIEIKLQNPNTSLVEVANVIETEPVLTGRMLKLANSVFFSGGRAECKSLTMAIGRLGLKRIRQIVYSVVVSRLFLKSEIIDQVSFWRHSLSVALLTRMLGVKTRLNRVDYESAYLAGLMHEIGILVFVYLVPDEYSELIAELENAKASLEFMEQTKFGVDHAELGSKFLEQVWQISAKVVSATKKHHDLFRGASRPPRIEHLLFLANSICNEEGITNGIPGPKDPLDMRAFESIGIPEDDLEGILEELDKAVNQAELIIGKSR